MTFVITQACCSDASCVAVCPVACIHPTPEERDFGSTEMLHIDPRSCIDCGACADACPVDAVVPLAELAASAQVFADINADYYRDRAPVSRDGRVEVPLLTDAAYSPPDIPPSLRDAARGLRVALVGTGPAGGYALQALLTSGARVTVVDRVPAPGGLVRYGVAPDHPDTKRIGDRFTAALDHPRVQPLLNVEVGTHVTHEELAAHHHAVVYAVGAAQDRLLGVAGEDLPGVMSARTFVAWYNAHPDVPADAVDLSVERVVLVGAGNVALDVARILTTDPETLATTDVADHALAALRRSRVREVVLLARRGPGDAAYSRSELRELLALEGVDVVVDADAATRALIESAAPTSSAGLLRAARLEAQTWPDAPPAGRRIVLAFDTSVTDVASCDVAGAADGPEVLSVGVTGPRGTARITAGLVLRSIGYQGAALAGLPFDPATHTIPNTAGRVEDPTTGRAMPGTYVVGWIKRGPAGGIGSNRECARESVAALVEDANAGRLSAPQGTARALRRLVTARRAEALGRRGVRAIERAERSRGVATGRPRVKLATTEALVGAARAKRVPARS